MTQGEDPPKRDERESATPHVSRIESERLRRTEQRLLLSVLIALVIVLIVLIAYLISGGSKPQAGTDAGLAPKPLYTIPGPGSGDAPRFTRPLSAAWGPNGDVYVSDTGNGRVCVFSDSGEFLREFGRQRASKPLAENAVLQQPGGLAVRSDGTVYVADIRAGEIVVFDAKDRFVKRIRPQEPGPARQKHWTPTDVAVSDALLYVTDSAGVAVFSADGSLRGRLDRGSDGVAFAYPNGVAVRPSGAVVLSDTNNRRVVAMEATGSLVWVAGPSDAVRRVIGLPRGLAVAQDGSILVADAFLFGIARLSQHGEFIERYGVRGSELGHFEFPNDVDVQGDLVLVADKENNRVQVIQWPALVGTRSK